MKHILITIAAVLLVGCGPPSNPEADRALLDAAEKGNIEAVKLLLINNGADVNAKNDRGGWTPLHYAASETDGYKEVVELLIAKGADVNAKNRVGITPLREAAVEDHKEIVELLIAKDADVNAKAEDGHTPLEWAIAEGKIATADLLRKHGGKTKKELEAAGK